MLIHKLSTASLALMVATIPLSRLYNINSYAIAVFLVLTTLTYKKKMFAIPNKTTVLFLFLYLAVIINLMVIGQPKIDSTIIKYLPLVLLPFLSQFNTNKKIVLNTFLYSVAICCLICIIYALIKSKGYIFYFHQPTKIIDIQLNYLSVFACFCLAILYQKILTSGKLKMESYLLIPFFFFSLSVFFNITGVLISIAITLLFLIVYTVKFKNFKLLVILVIIGCGGAFWMTSRPIIRAKIEKVISVQNYKTIEPSNGVSSRLLSWDCSLKLIQDSGLMGHGINNTAEFLTECYRSRIGDNSVQTLEQYNSHNQFLQTATSMGFIGLISLLSIYFVIIEVGLKQKNYLIISYFIIVLLFGATESFLIRQWGLIFFSFFTPFLLNQSDRANL